MVWNKMGVLVLGGTLLLGLAGAAAAMPMHDGPEGGRGKALAGEHEWAFGNGLDLTAQQHEQLKADRLAREKKLIQLQADKKVLKLDLRAAEEQETPDMSKVEALAEKIGNIQAKIIVERAKGREFFKSLLTPEQKKKMQEGFKGHDGKGCDGEKCEKCRKGEDQKYEK